MIALVVIDTVFCAMRTSWVHPPDRTSLVHLETCVCASSIAVSQTEIHERCTLADTLLHIIIYRAGVFKVGDGAPWGAARSFDNIWNLFGHLKKYYLV